MDEAHAGMRRRVWVFAGHESVVDASRGEDVALSLAVSAAVGASAGLAAGIVLSVAARAVGENPGDAMALAIPLVFLAAIGWWLTQALRSAMALAKVWLLRRRFGDPVVAPAGPAGELVRRIVADVAALPPELGRELGGLIEQVRVLVAELETQLPPTFDGSAATMAAQQARARADAARVAALAKRADRVQALRVEADMLELAHQQADAEAAIPGREIPDDDVAVAEQLRAAIEDTRRRLYPDPPTAP